MDVYPLVKIAARRHLFLGTYSLFRPLGMENGAPTPPPPPPPRGGAEGPAIG